MKPYAYDLLVPYVPTSGNEKTNIDECAKIRCAFYPDENPPGRELKNESFEHTLSVNLLVSIKVVYQININTKSTLTFSNRLLYNMG